MSEPSGEPGFYAPPIVELRQYAMRPGQRDVLIELFEREFVETQEAAGMAVLGQLRDLDEPDRYVWLRGFSDMATRLRGLTRFYGSPLWQRLRDATNATLLDSDNVLLLRPARPQSGLDLSGRARAPLEQAGAATAEGTPPITITTYSLAAAPSAELIAAACEVRPAPLAVYVTEAAVNDFPRLPVRQGEQVLVTIERGAVARRPELEGAATAIEVRRLVPAARSLLR